MQGFYPLLRNVCVHIEPTCRASLRDYVHVCPEKQPKIQGSQLHPEPSCCSYSPAHLLSIWKHPDVGSNAIPVDFLQWARQFLLGCLCNPPQHSVQHPVCFKPSQKVQSIWPYLVLQISGSQCFFRVGFSVSSLRFAPNRAGVAFGLHSV